MRNKIFLVVFFAITAVFVIFSYNNNDKLKQIDAEDNYIEIRTIEDLYNIRFGRANNYKLMNDLDFQDENSYADHTSVLYKDINKDGYEKTIMEELTESKGWVPIDVFSGVFDGQGYVIKNLYSKGSVAALFYSIRGEIEPGYIPVVKKYAEVKNVGIVNGELYGTSYAAGIAVTASATRIHNSFVDAHIYGPGYWNAGIVADTYNYTIIENCYVMGKIEGTGSSTYAGGIVATVYNGTTKVSNNYVTASIVGVNRVSGIVSQVTGASSLNSGNNIQFSDYINGDYSTWRNTAQVYVQDYALFSRTDTRIDVMSSAGDVIEKYSPQTRLERGGYAESLSTGFNRFEGIWLSYEDFKNKEFYSNIAGYSVETSSANIVVEAGFTDKCTYPGEKSCDENGGLTANQVLYYKHSLWDFEQTWEILDGAERPTLQVFNHGSEIKDDGMLSKAPIPPSNVVTNLSTYQQTDSVTLTWDEAYLVTRHSSNPDGLLYDIYMSIGTDGEKIEIQKSIRNLISNNGKHSTRVSIPNDIVIDSSNVVFYVVAKNGELENGGEASDYVMSNTVAIDSAFPVVQAKTNTKVIADKGFTNEDFRLSIVDATRTFVRYSINGGSFTNALTSKVYDEEGNYKFEVRDQFGNKTDFEIELSKQKPNLMIKVGNENIKNSRIVDSSVTASVEDSSLTLTYKLNNGEETSWTSGQKFEEDGHYYISATDKYGNVSYYNIVVDKKIPEMTKEKVDSNYVLKFSEYIARYSFDGKEWIDVNSLELTISSDKLNNKIYLEDTGGSISVYSFDASEDGNTFEIISIIACGITTLALIGGITFLIITRRRNG